MRPFGEHVLRPHQSRRKHARGNLGWAGLSLALVAAAGCANGDDDDAAPGTIVAASAGGVGGGTAAPGGGGGGGGGLGVGVGGPSVTSGGGTGGAIGSVPAGTGGAGSAGGGGTGASTGSGGSGGSGASGSGGTGGTGIAMGGRGGFGQGGTGGAAGSAGSAGAAGTSSAGSGEAGSGSAGTSGTTEPPAKFVGNITTSGMVRDGYAMYWDQITPENEGKWGSVQPSQGTFNWGPLDAIHNYAQANHIVFKEHTFVWGNQQPGWVNSSNAETAVKAWMQAFCDRYPDVQLIDVVNEPPPHTTPAYINGMGGTGSSGYDWIVNAFKWARDACPNATLILNDYNTIEYGNDNAHIIDIVNKIKAAGAPIDAIGAQAHDAYKIDTNTLKSNIAKLAATGLPVYITEYDIPVADDNQQKTIMQDQITMFWNDDNVKGVTLWGYIVGATWKSNTGIQQQNGSMRPAMTWLMDFLGR